MKRNYYLQENEEQIKLKDRVIYILALIIAFIGIFGFFVKIVFF